MSECDCPQCSGLAVHHNEVGKGCTSQGHTQTGGGIAEPTTQDLLLLEVRDLTASVGELRLQLNGVWKRVTALEGRTRLLEDGFEVVDLVDIETGDTVASGKGRVRPWTGTIQGLEGEFTVTPPPEWERA